MVRPYTQVLFGVNRLKLTTAILSFVIMLLSAASSQRLMDPGRTFLIASLPWLFKIDIMCGWREWSGLSVSSQMVRTRSSMCMSGFPVQRTDADLKKKV